MTAITVANSQTDKIPSLVRKQYYVKLLFLIIINNNTLDLQI